MVRAENRRDGGKTNTRGPEVPGIRPRALPIREPEDARADEAPLPDFQHEGRGSVGCLGHVARIPGDARPVGLSEEATSVGGASFVLRFRHSEQHATIVMNPGVRHLKGKKRRK